MTYSIEFRKEVLRVKQTRGLSYEKTSQLFGVGASTILRWVKRVEPKNKRNRQPSKIDMQALVRDVHEQPDAYQYERAERFGVSASGIRWALKRLGMSCKKKPRAPQGRR